MNNKYKILSISILIVASIITGFSAWRLSKIGFDYNFENFFPRNDPDTDFFNEHRSRFGTDNDFILIGIKNSSGIFRKDFLTKIDTLEKQLKKIHNVNSVVSPLAIKDIIRDPLLGNVIEIPFLRWSQPEFYQIDSVRIAKNPQLKGSLFSKDFKSVCLIINHKEKIKDKDCIAIAKDIEDVIKPMGFEEYHLAGRSIGQAYYTRVMEIDMYILLAVAFAVILIIMILIYRNVIGVLMPFIVVALVVIWSMAFMEITGKHIDVLANAIPTILVVTGLSVAVHVITKYIDHIKDGWSKFDSLKYTITHVGLANVFTTVTTVVGFASLATSGIKPIDDFGLYTAMGVALSFVIGYTVLPALLYLLPAPKPSGGFVPKKMTWDNFLYNVFTFIMKYKKTVLFVFLGFTLVLGIFTFRIKENTYLLEDLKDTDKMKQDFLFFEKQFQGTRPFEMSITAKGDKTIFDKEVILEIEKIENYLQKDYGLGFILSPVAIVKASNRSISGGDDTQYSIPESNSKFKRIISELRAIKENSFVKSVVSENGKIGRLRTTFPDLGSYEANKKNVAFYEFAKTNINPEIIEFKLTGTAELIDKNNRNLAGNILQGLFIAFALISIIFAILFKNWKMIIIGIIPNIVPLLVLSGTMGILGINMKMSTAILFTVAFGIAVDDTIHFLSRFKLELSKNKSILYALKRTYLTSGKAMIITTILLIIGFGVLGLSSFYAVQVIGSMTSYALFFALVCDLIFLPVLIVLFYRDKTHKKLE